MGWDIEIAGGATDRVAWEIEVESLGAFEGMMDALATEAEKFGAWFGEFSALIQGANSEHWAIDG